MRPLACCFIIGLALLPVPALADRLDEIKARGVIRIVTTREAPFLVRTGKQPKGFIADVAARLARELGVRHEVDDGAPKNFAKRIKGGKIDLAVGDFTGMDKAMLELALSPPISRHGVELITRLSGGTSHSPSSDTGPIAYLRASAAVARASYPKERLWRLNSLGEVFQALTLGTASAALLGPPWPAMILAQNPTTFAAAGKPGSDTRTTFATLASETRLAEHVAQWVRSVEAS